LLDNIINELQQLRDKILAPSWLLPQLASEEKSNLYPELEIFVLIILPRALKAGERKFDSKSSNKHYHQWRHTATLTVNG
jgi:hypothetical protein